MWWRIGTLYEGTRNDYPPFTQGPVAPLFYLNIDSSCYNDPSVYTSMDADESVSNRWLDLARCRTNYHFLLPLFLRLRFSAIREQYDKQCLCDRSQSLEHALKALTGV